MDIYLLFVVNIMGRIEEHCFSERENAIPAFSGAKNSQQPCVLIHNDTVIGRYEIQGMRDHDPLH